ncbi:AraC family transcriptional regulator [Paenibacillus radicis (ex Xue et al. 2023)]|uniref:AraC family transcriptional regulator n=1 Tax=Paenibacillus radicis (ex Xue et al. 2023) TaxID=2972489 RepID=A0ABT1YE54_9BACL|nr:AraC family transcriptional regulator [Paenibacillus radicis (ex Xue et al. 2023)]MCR8631212.1 AraC family transcriptional regulator [Paenibacillus radicis (ex Xue et al. 2023)]
MSQKSKFDWLKVRKQDQGYRRSFYKKSLLMIVLIACIPGLITGAAIYWLTTGKIEGELQRLHQSQIKQRAENIDDQLAFLELTFSHWSFDPKFDQKLKDIDFVYKYDQVQELYRTMIVIEGSHPLIEKAEFFLNKPKPLTMNKEKYVFLQKSSEIDTYNSYLKQKKTIFWTDTFLNNAQESNNSGKSELMLMTKFPGGSLEPFGVLIATIDEAKLSKLLRTLTPYDEGSSILMSTAGNWFLTGSGKRTELDSALREEYEKREGKESSFLFTHNKTTYSVSSGSFSRLGNTWTYLSAAPLTAITSPVLFVSKVILMISLGGLLLAFLFSWLGTSRLYTPIERLLGLLAGNKESTDRSDHKDEFGMIENHWLSLTSESESLRNTLNQQLPLVREGYMLQLVQGYLFSYSEHDIRERLMHFGRDTEEKSFVAIMLQIRGLSGMEGRFSSGDEELVTFAVTNIVGELSQNKGLEREIVNFHDLTIGVLLMLPSDESPKRLRMELHGFCEELIQAIGRTLKLQITLSISKQTLQIKQIPYMFEEARHALSYRELPEVNQIIDLEQLNKTDSQRKFSYPFTLEKEIIHSIRMGSEDEAAELIEQFLQELSHEGSTEMIVRQGMLQLLGSVLNSMVQSGMNPIHIFEGANLFDHLSMQNSPDEMLKWFKHKVIGTFVQELISKQDFHLKQMVEQVMLYLNERYMTDLSLDSCADHFGTSPYTLSRAFKQISGINFIDYLTNIRLATAKQLLRESELKITEVAERVGYQQSYFNRIFKKYEGVTPSQYRDMLREH